jgi:hypothetical protein
MLLAHKSDPQWITLYSTIRMLQVLCSVNRFKLLKCFTTFSVLELLLMEWYLEYMSLFHFFFQVSTTQLYVGSSVVHETFHSTEEPFHQGSLKILSLLDVEIVSLYFLVESLHLVVYINRYDGYIYRRHKSSRTIKLYAYRWRDPHRIVPLLRLGV